MCDPLSGTRKAVMLLLMRNFEICCVAGILFVGSSHMWTLIHAPIPLQTLPFWFWLKLRAIHR